MKAYGALSDLGQETSVVSQQGISSSSPTGGVDDSSKDSQNVGYAEDSQSGNGSMEEVGEEYTTSQEQQPHEVVMTASSEETQS